MYDLAVGGFLDEWEMALVEVWVLGAVWRWGIVPFKLNGATLWR